MNKAAAAQALANAIGPITKAPRSVASIAWTPFCKYSGSDRPRSPEPSNLINRKSGCLFSVNRSRYAPTGYRAM